MRRVVIATALCLLPAFAGAEEIGDADRGYEIYGMCAGCHEVGEDATNGIGPHLNGIFGRTAGSLDGYEYSEGLARAGADGLVWDLRALNAYITNPRTLVSGTNMMFDGLEDEQERLDVLAFLRAYSDNPQNIPGAQPTAIRTNPDLSEATLALQGDPAYGEYLSGECTTCHQRDGSAEGIPSITGWPEEHFVLAMHAYKQQLRPHQVMQMMASRLSDEEIAALAAYFATIE